MLQSNRFELDGNTAPELLGPGDYNALAEYFDRLRGATDRFGLALHAPFSGAAEARDPEARARCLSQWERPLSEPAWRRTFAFRDGAGAVVARLDLLGPELEAELHRARVALGVEPAFQRRGLGERLLRHAIAFARDSDLAWLDLWVFAHNEPALALYRKVGFVEIGRHRDQFRWRRMSIDDIAMAYRLDPHLPHRVFQTAPPQ